MEIHFQTTDHVVAVEKVAEQHIRTKYCKCNSFRVISHIIILAKIAITHSKVGQSSPNPKNIEEQKNSLGLVIYQKCVTVVVSETSITFFESHGCFQKFKFLPVISYREHTLTISRMCI